MKNVSLFEVTHKKISLIGVVCSWKFLESHCGSRTTAVILPHPSTLCFIFVAFLSCLSTFLIVICVKPCLPSWKAQTRRWGFKITVPRLWILFYRWTLCNHQLVTRWRNFDNELKICPQKLGKTHIKSHLIFELCNTTYPHFDLRNLIRAVFYSYFSLARSWLTNHLRYAVFTFLLCKKTRIFF